jgi:hypothetical protein
MIITYSEWVSVCVYVCVCSLRYTVCIAHAPCCHLWSSPLCNIFPTLSQNDKAFEKTLLDKKCLFGASLQLLSEMYFILRRNERDVIENVCWSSCKIPDVHTRFWLDLNFSDRISKNTRISNFMKILPAVAELVHGDGRTDITELTVALRNLANVQTKYATSDKVIIR